MEQNNILIIGIVALAVGALIGYLLGRSGSDAGKRQALSSQLDDVKEELTTYKQGVNEHFEKTAELVNKLTDTYKDVHQHLAQGAQSLCDSDTASLALNENMQPKLEATAETAIPVVTDVVPNEEAEKVPEPPRDYAAKSTDEKGTLSESFGLKSKKENADDDAGTDADANADAVTESAEVAAGKGKETENPKEKSKKAEEATS